MDQSKPTQKITEDIRGMSETFKKGNPDLNDKPRPLLGDPFNPNTEPSYCTFCNDSVPIVDVPKKEDAAICKALSDFVNQKMKEDKKAVLDAITESANTVRQAKGPVRNIFPSELAKKVNVCIETDGGTEKEKNKKKIAASLLATTLSNEIQAPMEKEIAEQTAKEFKALVPKDQQAELTKEIQEIIMEYEKEKKETEASKQAPVVFQFGLVTDKVGLKKRKRVPRYRRTGLRKKKRVDYTQFY